MAIAEKYHDTDVRQSISALMAVEPGPTRTNAVRAYMVAIGVGMTMMAKTARAEGYPMASVTMGTPTQC